MTQEEILERVKNLRPMFEKAEKALNKELEGKFTSTSDHFALIAETAKEVSDIARDIAHLSAEFNKANESWLEEFRDKVDEIVREYDEETELRDFIELSDGSCATALISVYPCVKRYHATHETEALREGTIKWRAYISARTTTEKELLCGNIINGRLKPLIIDGEVDA